MYMNRAPFAGYNASQPVSNIGMAGDGSFSQPMPATPAVAEWGRELYIPANADEGVEDFLEFANRAHGYTKYVNSTDSIKPDLPSAILVLDGVDGKLYVLEEDSAEEEKE
jgi:hypothetical protein